jgi:hypothetical protein
VNVRDVRIKTMKLFRSPRFHGVALLVGVAWGAIALLLAATFVGSSADAGRFLLPFLLSGVATSYAMILGLGGRIFAIRGRGRWFLPFLTIPMGVFIWCAAMFSGAAVVSRLNDAFDGFGFFLLCAWFISLTWGLPLTYPAALLTHSAVNRVARRLGGAA